jgi:hypothetical protein
MEEIVVEVHHPDDPPRSERFIGRWLVRPNRDQTRPEETGYQEYWGVALTRRGQIAVYNVHPDGAWAELAIYASLDAAKRSNCVPASILAPAAAELGQVPNEDLRKGLAIGRIGSWRGADGLIRLDI